MIGEYTTTDIFDAIQADLQPFMAAQKGLISIAKDPYEVLELLGYQPGTLRVIIAWDGEEAIGHESSGIAKQLISVLVSRNRGLSVLKGDSLSASGGAWESLTKLTGQVRDRLRRLRFPEASTSEQLAFEGTETVVVENYPLDAFRIKFSLKIALPEPSPLNL